jgi:hypothetical protein
MRIALLLVAILAGCHATNLPTYPRMPIDHTLQKLAQKQHEIGTISAEAAITIDDPHGQSIHLDAAIVMRPAEFVRLRAWKVGLAVLDLTLTSDGVWVAGPRDDSHRDEIRRAGGNAAKIARTWSLLAGRFFDSPDLQSEEHGNALIVTRPWEDGSVRCEVDRSTLTIKRYILLDRTNQSRFTLDLERYANFNGIVWPQRMIARSDSGTITIDVRGVEFNGELPADAFVPPRRAEKLP